MYLIIFGVGVFIGFWIFPVLMSWDILYNNATAAKKFLNELKTEDDSNLSGENKQAINEFKTVLGKTIKEPSPYVKENIFREKQEIIKRNTAKEIHCGLCEAGECKYIGYCKYQRNYTEYGCDKVVLCMREGKSE